MRLIDADELLREHKDDITNWDSPYGVCNKSIENAPTVDAVEVVRCRDCDYYILGLCTKICSDGIIRKDVFCKRKKDDFCNYGSKKR